MEFVIHPSKLSMFLRHCLLFDLEIFVGGLCQGCLAKDVFKNIYSIVTEKNTGTIYSNGPMKGKKVKYTTGYTSILPETINTVA